MNMPRAKAKEVQTPLLDCAKKDSSFLDVTFKGGLDVKSLSSHLPLPPHIHPSPLVSFSTSSPLACTVQREAAFDRLFANKLTTLTVAAHTYWLCLIPDTLPC